MEPLASQLSRRQLISRLALTGAAVAVPWARAPRASAQSPTPPAAPAAPAAATPAVNSAVYRFSIGDFEATVISDGYFGVKAPLQPNWAPEAKLEELEAALRKQFLPTDRLELALNVLIVRTGKETVLIDAGTGAAAGPTSGKLRAGLTAAGIAPADITVVFLSHAHGDHLGGMVEADGRAVFSRAQHFVSAPEWQFWTEPSPNVQKAAAAAAQKNLLALKDQFKQVEPGKTTLPDGFEALLVPGHTPGHMPIRLRSGSEELLHFADTAHHPVVMFANPEWTVAFDVDPRAAARSRKALFTEAAAKRTRLFSYHLPFPGVGHVRTAAEPGSFEWTPEPWRAQVKG